MRFRQNIRCHATDPRVRRCRRFASGFTLIELLVVVAILAVLTSLYWGFTSTDRPRPGKGCQDRLQKIYVAMEIYANDHAGSFPVAPGARTSEEVLDVLVPKYSADTSIFICP